MSTTPEDAAAAPGSKKARQEGQDDTSPLAQLLTRGDGFARQFLETSTRFLERGAALQKVSRGVRAAAQAYQIPANIAGTTFEVVLENVHPDTNARDATHVHLRSRRHPVVAPPPRLDTQFVTTLTVQRREQRSFFTERKMASVAKALLLRSSYERLSSLFIQDSLLTRQPLPHDVMLNFFGKLMCRPQGGVRLLFLRRIKGPLEWLFKAATDQLVDLTVANCRRVDHFDLTQALKRCPNLEKLRLHFTGISADTLQAVSKCTKLTSFTSGPFLHYGRRCLHRRAEREPYHDNQGWDAYFRRAIDAVVPVVQNCRRLRVLSLRQQVLSQGFYAAVATSAVQLETLRLQHCCSHYHADGEPAAKTFETLCQNLQALKTLEIVEATCLHPRFHPVIVRNMLQHVPKLKRLSYLKVDHAVHGNISAEEYGQLAACPRLRSLIVWHSHTDMAPLFAAAKKRGFPRGMSLRLLELRHCAYVGQDQLSGLLQHMLDTTTLAPAQPWSCTVSVDRFYDPPLASKVLRHPRLHITTHTD